MWAATASVASDASSRGDHFHDPRHMGRNTHGAKHRLRKEAAAAEAAAAAEVPPVRRTQPGAAPRGDDDDDDDELDVDADELAAAQRDTVPADLDDISFAREQRRREKKDKRAQRRAAEEAAKEAARAQGLEPQVRVLPRCREKQPPCCHLCPLPCLLTRLPATRLRRTQPTPKEHRRLERQRQQAAREAAKEAKRKEWAERVAGGDAAPAAVSAQAAPPAAATAGPVADSNTAGEAAVSLSQTVFVCGLPWNCTATDIASVFQPHGAVAEVERLVVSSTGEFDGMAMVRLADEPSFHACLALNGLPLDDSVDPPVVLSVKRAKSKAATDALQTRTSEAAAMLPSVPHGAPPVSRKQHTAPLEVDAQSRVVYVGNLSFEVDEEVLRSAFPELGIETITWGCADPADPATFKGYAHVCFTTHDHAAAATRSNGADLLGRPMRIAFEVPRRKPRTQAEHDAAAAAVSAARPEGATRAYVTGLPYDAEPAAAEAALTAALPGIQRVKLGFDATSGAFRGYAHLEFGTTAELDAAVGAVSTVVLGRKVTITYAKEKAMPPRGPGVSRKKGALPPRETAARGDNKRQRK